MTLMSLISTPDKVFWPDLGYTKLDLARFYQAVFPKVKAVRRRPRGDVGALPRRHAR